MLYLFNLPNKAAADNSAAAACSGGAGSSNGAANAPVAAAALMVRGLADWEPHGSQISRRYVEQLMAVLDRHKQQPRQHQHHQQEVEKEDAQQQQQQQAMMQVEPDGQQQQQQADAAGPSQPAAAGQKRQQQQQPRPAPAAAKLRRINPEPLVPDSEDASVEAQLTNVSEGLGGLGLGGPGSGAAQAQVQARPGSLQHMETSIRGGERLLAFMVQNLAATCSAAEALQQKFGPAFPGTLDTSFMSCGWEVKCKCIGQLLQDEQMLRGVQRLQRLRFIFADESIAYKWISTVKDYTAVINGLRKAAQAQEALLGWRGQQRQQQQWQQQQDDGDRDYGVAVGRAVYLLLLLRLLAPSGLPVMKQNARVLVFK